MFEALIASRYGVDALTCEALVIEWAAEVLAKTEPVAKVAREWKKLNRRREKMGRYTNIPPYGSALRAAYFA